MNILELVLNLSTAEYVMIFMPVVTYWVYSTFFYILSHLKLTTVELHRLSNMYKRPPNRITVTEVVVTVAIQHIIQIILTIFLTIITENNSHSGGENQIEDWYIVIVKLVIGTFILDTYQYWVHRYFHVNRFLYNHFHSVHHRLTEPYAYGALYNHPVEGLLMDSVGAAIPGLILKMHPYTSAIFFCFSTLKTVDDHCGFALPYDPLQLIFPNNARYHDFHHYGKGTMYNFSQPFYTFWDKIMHTDYEDAMRREKQQVEGKKKNM